MATRKRTPHAAKRYPALPLIVEGPAGPCTVRLTKESIKYEGTECGGLWDPEERTIDIDARASRRAQWSYLYHEWGHVVLTDSGLSNALPDDAQEAICDAISAARMRERFS